MCYKEWAHGELKEASVVSSFTLSFFAGSTEVLAARERKPIDFFAGAQRADNAAAIIFLSTI